MKTMGIPRFELKILMSTQWQQISSRSIASDQKLQSPHQWYIPIYEPEQWAVIELAMCQVLVRLVRAIL